MPNQPAKASGTRNSSQTQPAFWIQVSVPAAILPISVPLSLISSIGAPAAAPNTPAVITSGIRICMVVTPKLPRPAFRPSASPCWFFGKKVLMLLIEQAKLPPPMPERKASNWNTHSGVSWLCSAKPAPAAGIISSAVVRKMVLRPPAMRIMNDAGMRRVAPVRPAMAVRVNSSAGANGKPRLSICTVTMPHISQMAKPISRLGMEIHRLRLATRLPVVSQNIWSSTSHFSILLMVDPLGAGPRWHTQRDQEWLAR